MANQQGALVNWRYLDREGNVPADILARKSHYLNNICTIYDVVPHFIRTPLDVDLLGIMPSV